MGYKSHSGFYPDVSNYRGDAYQESSIMLKPTLFLSAFIVFSYSIKAQNDSSNSNTILVSELDMESINSLPSKGIYRIPQDELNEILNNKEEYLNVNPGNLYDERFTISLKDQLLIMIENQLIDEEYVINFFEKISEKYQKKIINQIFHLGIDNKYDNIIQSFSLYLESNKDKFEDNYRLIVNLNMGIDVEKNTEMGFKKLNDNFDNEQHNKILLLAISQHSDNLSSLNLLEKLILESKSSLIAYPNKNVFYTLFNRCFNNIDENRIVALCYKYLETRPLDNEWLLIFDLVQYYHQEFDISALTNKKKKEISSDNEYAKLLNEKIDSFSYKTSQSRLDTLKSLSMKINYSKILTCDNDRNKSFNLCLKEELGEAILFGDGEFGSIHYATLVCEYFKPISNGLLDDIIFIDRVNVENYEDREFIAIFNESTAIGTKPKFYADWIDSESFFPFMNFVAELLGETKEFNINEKGYLSYN